MIAWLRGRLRDKQPTRLVVDVHGVGYDVAIPVSTYYAVGDEGSEVELRIHTHVREDAISLFGFLTAYELTVFEKLIATSGIGPKLGLSVLSGIDAVDFSGAVQRGDVARLTRIPGVGKKTAERICLELKDKLKVTGLAAKVSRGSTPPDASADILNALLALGYNEREALGAMKQLPTDIAVSEGIRQALKSLSKG